MDFYESHHRPVWCEFGEKGGKIIRRGKGRFHFEDKWFMEKDFVPDVLCEWRSLVGEGDLMRKLGLCGKFLMSWARKKCNITGKEIESMRKERLRLLEKVGQEGEMDTRLDELSRRLEEATEKEAIHWKQRSRTNWLANGDRNTSMFHVLATKRQKRNEILEIEDDGGSVWKGEEEKTDVILRFFRNLFRSSRPSDEAIARVTDTISEKLGDEDIEMLNKPFEASEVKQALFDMHPTKAPGMNGFNARFFQKFWLAVEEEVTEEVLAILNDRADVSRWNETLICLIPKTHKPRKVVDFRPLSL